MTRRVVLVTGVYALAAFGMTLAIFAPRGLQATDEPAVVGSIEQPKLVMDGCEFSIAAGGKYEPGDTPVLKLTAVNNSDQERKVDWRVTLSATAPVSPMSRMLPTPKEIWQKTDLITLSAGERKTVELQTDVKLPKGNITAVLTSGQQSAALLVFTVGAKEKEWVLR